MLRAISGTYCFALLGHTSLAFVGVNEVMACSTAFESYCTLVSFMTAYGSELNHFLDTFSLIKVFTTLAYRRRADEWTALARSDTLDGTEFSDYTKTHCFNGQIEPSRHKIDSTECGKRCCSKFIASTKCIRPPTFQPSTNSELPD